MTREHHFHKTQVWSDYTWVWRDLERDYLFTYLRYIIFAVLFVVVKFAISMALCIGLRDIGNESDDDDIKCMNKPHLFQMCHTAFREKKKELNLTHLVFMFCGKNAKYAIASNSTLSTPWANVSWMRKNKNNFYDWFLCVFMTQQDTHRQVMTIYFFVFIVFLFTWLKFEYFSLRSILGSFIVGESLSISENRAR